MNGLAISLLFRSFCRELIWATSWENLFMPYANNKGADQPAYLRSLIRAFFVHCLDSIIPLDSISKISSPYLSSVAAQAGLCLTWSKTPNTGFLMARLIFIQFSLSFSTFCWRMVSTKPSQTNGEDCTLQICFRCSLINKMQKMSLTIHYLCHHGNYKWQKISW